MTTVSNHLCRLGPTATSKHFSKEQKIRRTGLQLQHLQRCACRHWRSMAAVRAAAATGVGGPVLSPGRPGTYDDAKIGGAVVRWSDQDSRWQMWYYGRDAKFDPEAPATMSSGRIAWAVSDDGVAWDRQGSVLEPSTSKDDFDSLHIGVSDVFQHEGEFWMLYYGGRPGDGFMLGDKQIKGFPTRIGLAKSADGKSWRRVRGQAEGGALLDVGAPGEWDATYCGWPSALHDGRQFRLYYHSFDTASKLFLVGSAVSADGVSWVKEGQIVWEDEAQPHDVGGAGVRQVMHDPSASGRAAYTMLYTAVDKDMKRSIGMAVSNDGVRFRRHGQGPVLAGGGEGSWDAGGTGAPWVCRGPDGKLRMYYIGLGAEANAAAGVGLAFCDNGEAMTVWTKLA